MQRDALSAGFRVVAVAICTLMVVACGEKPAASTDTPANADAQQRVVLYSSVDSHVIRDLLAAFESQTGIAVDLVGDTEATKTTGLVERLITERESPVAHVWWSSEPFGTIKLAREGVLAPFDPEYASSFDTGWPASLTGDDAAWHGMGLRARVIAYHTEQLDERSVPATLWQLTDSAWRGRVGMARPQFGTTRGHMAALVDAWGPEAFEQWLTAMHENGLRLYDGNAAVVRAIHLGEIDLCLTDSDDVHHARRNGWAVGMVYETRSDRPGETGPLLLPNTAALIARDDLTPETREAAETLLNWILSPRCEQLLAASDSKNFPVTPEAQREFPALATPDGWTPDLAAVESRVPAAMAICDRVLGP